MVPESRTPVPRLRGLLHRRLRIAFPPVCLPARRTVPSCITQCPGPLFDGADSVRRRQSRQSVRLSKGVEDVELQWGKAAPDFLLRQPLRVCAAWVLALFCLNHMPLGSVNTCLPVRVYSGTAIVEVPAHPRTAPQGMWEKLSPKAWRRRSACSRNILTLAADTTLPLIRRRFSVA